MKNFFALLLLTLYAFTGFGASRTPLNRAFLQSNMDGNGYAITNATFVGDGSGLTGLPAAGGSQPASLNLTNWSELDTNTFLTPTEVTNAAAYQAYLTTNGFTSGSVQTNISWIEITNVSSIQIPAAAITNAQWQYGDADLTNWATLNTNVLSTLGQTNISYESVTNAPWQMGSVNLTNWASIPTNYVPPETGHSTNADNATFVTTATLTNQAYASNVISGGQIVSGAVETNQLDNGYLQLTGDKRRTTFDLSFGTNVLGFDGTGAAGTNWVLEQIASLGEHMYANLGVTNTGAIDSRTNNWQAWDMPITEVATNSTTGLTSGDYVMNVITTNTFTRIESGPVSVEYYIWRTGNVAGTLTLHPEIYLFDTTSNTLFYEISAGAGQTIPTGTGPQLYQWSISVPSYTHTNAFKIVVAWKMDSTPNAAAVLNFASGGIYDSHATIVQNISSITIDASQITGVLSPSQISTNTAAANQVLTATSASSAAWQNRVVRSVGISVDGGGSAITSGTKGFIAVPYDGTIQSCTLMASPSGSIEFRLWRTNSADGSFPPTAVGAIGTNALTSDVYNVDSTLMGWTTALSAGDVLAFNIPATATTITNCTLQLKIQP